MLNVIAIQARLVADPELRKTTTGVSTATIRVACDRSYVKQGEARQTDFFDIVCWRGTAEFACKYFRKGQMVVVNGSLQTRQWEDKSGNKRTAYEIVADNLHFADSKGGGQQREPEPQQATGADDFAVVEEAEDLPF